MSIRQVIAAFGMVAVLSWPSITLGGVEKPDPIAISKQIDSILYSDLSKDDMLVALKPFVEIGLSEKEFRKRTGLDPGFCLVGGPGVADCHGTSNGLNLILDPSHKIRIIRREQKSIAGKEYAQMSISANGFEWKGYSRWYPE